MAFRESDIKKKKKKIAGSLILHDQMASDFPLLCGNLQREFRKDKPAASKIMSV